MVKRKAEEEGGPKKVGGVPGNGVLNPDIFCGCPLSTVDVASLIETRCASRMFQTGFSRPYTTPAVSNTREKFKKELNGAAPYTHLRVKHPCAPFHVLDHSMCSILAHAHRITKKLTPGHGPLILGAQIPNLADEAKMRAIHDELVENRE